MREYVGERWGGRISEYLKPWILRYALSGDGEKRPVEVHSHVWPSTGFSGNGHHHDPLANVALAREMRSRALKSD